MSEINFSKLGFTWKGNEMLPPSNSRVTLTIRITACITRSLTCRSSYISARAAISG